MRIPLLAATDAEQAVAAWRALGSPKQVVLVAGGDDSVEMLQRLGRRTSVWLEATPADDEEALDLAVAGASHILARWPRDRAWVLQQGAELGELLVVACDEADEETVRAAAPECLVARSTADGLDAPEPAPAPAEETEPVEPEDRQGRMIL
ncbi:MAG: hypothetical protein AABX89_07775 [Candidatus Thermoplasmatota archaeon]